MLELEKAYSERHNLKAPGSFTACCTLQILAESDGSGRTLLHLCVAAKSSRGGWTVTCGMCKAKITQDLQEINQDQLGGGFKYFLFHPYLGKWSYLTNIFQMVRNHQVVNVWLCPFRGAGFKDIKVISILNGRFNQQLGFRQVMSSDAIDVSVDFLYKIRSGYKITALAVAAFSKAAIKMHMFGSNKFLWTHFGGLSPLGWNSMWFLDWKLPKVWGHLVYLEKYPQGIRQNHGTSFFHKGILSVQADTI